MDYCQFMLMASNPVSRSIRNQGLSHNRFSPFSLCAIFYATSNALGAPTDTRIPVIIGEHQLIITRTRRLHEYDIETARRRGKQDYVTQATSTR
jgi:hypothetical protein